MFAFFWVAWTVTWTARKHALAIGADVHKTYLICGVWTIFLWFLYPIAWGISEGGNVIAPDSEAVFYGILDLLAKPVFGALLLWGHKDIDPARLGREFCTCVRVIEVLIMTVHIRDYEEAPPYTEKMDPSRGHTNGTNGTDANTATTTGASV